MENNKITAELLLENRWVYDDDSKSYHKDWNGSRYRLFLSHNYGIDGNYFIKLQQDLSDHSPSININCLTMRDLESLQYLFHRATALDVMKNIMRNYL